MTRHAGNPRAELREWRAETLRLSTFHALGVLAELPQARDWWREVTGAETENRSENRKNGSLTDAGPWGDGSLVLQVLTSENRVNWFFGDTPSPDNPISEASLVDRVHQFVDPMARWLDTCPPATRIAFGAVVVLPVADRITGYNRVSDYLNFDIDGTDAADFMFQINRVRRSAVAPEIQINRLARWSVGVFLRFALSLSAQGSMIEQAATGAGTSFVRLELDINTHPDSASLAGVPSF